MNNIPEFVALFDRMISDVKQNMISNVCRELDAHASALFGLFMDQLRKANSQPKPILFPPPPGLLPPPGFPIPPGVLPPPPLLGPPPGTFAPNESQSFPTHHRESACNQQQAHSAPCTASNLAHHEHDNVDANQNYQLGQDRAPSLPTTDSQPHNPSQDAAMPEVVVKQECPDDHAMIEVAQSTRDSSRFPSDRSTMPRSQHSASPRSGANNEKRSKSTDLSESGSKARSPSIGLHGASPKKNGHSRRNGHDASSPLKNRSMSEKHASLNPPRLDSKRQPSSSTFAMPPGCEFTPKRSDLPVCHQQYAARISPHHLSSENCRTVPHLFASSPTGKSSTAVRSALNTLHQNHSEQQDRRLDSCPTSLTSQLNNTVHNCSTQVGQTDVVIIKQEENQCDRPLEQHPTQSTLIDLTADEDWDSDSDCECECDDCVKKSGPNASATNAANNDDDDVQILEPEPKVARVSLFDELCNYIPSSNKLAGSGKKDSSRLPGTFKVPTLQKNQTKVFKNLRRKCLVDGCDLMFHTRQQLNQHLAEKHAILGFRCVIRGCSESFNNGISLNNHVRVDHAGHRFLCPKCDSELKDRQCLYQHVYHYHYEGKFGCAQADCDFVATTRQEVLKHFGAKHRSLVCSVPLCGRSFRCPSTLLSHERAHRNIRPYRCTWPACGEEFVERSKAVRHIRAVHFCLPPTIKEQNQLQIVDNRNPYQYVYEIPEVLNNK